MEKLKNSTRDSLSSIQTFYQQNPLKFLYYTSIGIGFLIRLIISVHAWGLKHPDEIFQSLEISHYLVFGTGHIPPEFQPSNPAEPSYAAARSWLFPLFFAIFMWVGKFLSLDYHYGTLLLIKIYMAFHATLLIPAVYKLTHQISEDEVTATISAFFIAFWFRIIEFTVRTFTNTFFLPLIFYGIYRVLKLQDENRDPSKREIVMIGFLLGLSTYIRVDMGVLVFGFFVVFFNKEQLTNYIKIGLASLSYWFAGALIDYLIYDGARYFSPIINWFTFNFIEGQSARFGVSGPFSYFSSLIIADMLSTWFLVMILLPIALYVGTGKKFLRTTKLGQSYIRLLAVNAIVWIIYSNVWPVFDFSNGFSVGIASSHKELRFVIGALTTLMMNLAVMIRVLITLIPRNRASENSDISKNATSEPYDLSKTSLETTERKVLVFLLLLFLLTSLTGVAYRRPYDNYQGLNRNLVHIGAHGEPDAIYIPSSWTTTGYYTYTHVDESTQFHFDLFGKDTIPKWEKVIRSQPENTYLIITDTVTNTMSHIYDLLSQYNWTLYYQAHGVPSYSYVA